MEVDLLDVRRGDGGHPPSQRGSLTGVLSTLLDEPIEPGGRRVKTAAWLLLLETALAGAALMLDSIEAQGGVSVPPEDISNPTTAAFALIIGPLLFLPVLILLVVVAIVVGAWPRGGRWLTIPAQMAPAMVLLISLRGVLEVIAALAMTAVAIYVELLLFKRPGAAAAG
jgi:hypothetical protein